MNGKEVYCLLAQVLPRASALGRRVPSECRRLRVTGRSLDRCPAFGSPVSIAGNDVTGIVFGLFWTKRASGRAQVNSSQ